jgi:hypothetical protein
MKPIAWYDPTNGIVSADKDSSSFTPLGQVWPLYSQSEPPRTWAGLIEEEAIELAIKVIARLDMPPEAKMQLQQQFSRALNEPNSLWMLFAAEIEAKLKEKNT